MPRKSRNSLRLDADYTEDTVGFALESFLTLLSFPRQRFSIEPFSRAKERWLGADARLDSRIRGFRPFYMQFKRPSAYPDHSTARIIKERKDLELDSSPRSLYFSLREKQENHRSYQHNVLFRLRKHLIRRGIGDAAYVCPLFLDRSAYRFHLHVAGLSLWPRFWRLHPWDFEEIILNHGGSEICFNRIPVLAEHVSIPPHDAVINAKHMYSFTEMGTDLCFHSPMSLPEGANLLPSFLTKISMGFLGDGEKILLENANKELQDLMGVTEEAEAVSSRLSQIDSDDPIANWLEWGDILRREFSIDQYALVKWEE